MTEAERAARACWRTFYMFATMEGVTDAEWRESIASELDTEWPDIAAAMRDLPDGIQ